MIRSLLGPFSSYSLHPPIARNTLCATTDGAPAASRHTPANVTHVEFAHLRSEAREFLRAWLRERSLVSRASPSASDTFHCARTPCDDAPRGHPVRPGVTTLSIARVLVTHVRIITSRNSIRATLIYPSNNNGRYRGYSF